jgi:hypothetical protein
LVIAVRKNMILINPYSFAAAGGGGFTITWQSSGSRDVSTGSTIGPIHPSSIAAGNLLILIVGQKPATANGGGVTTPSGWTLLTSLTGAGGYGATLGENTGNTNIFAYYKIAAGGETGALTVSLTDNNECWAIIQRLSKSGGTWDVAAATGEDSTGSSGFSASCTSDPGVTTNDFVIAAAVVPASENFGFEFAGTYTITQTSVTFGSVTLTENNLWSTSNGNIAGATWRAAVSSGTGSANPTIAATMNAPTSTNSRGAGVFIRIRAV